MPKTEEPLPEPPTNETSLVGRKIGKYEILREIARGGMGTVYEAHNTSIGKRVAMKFIDTALAARSKDAVLRFQREAEAASAVESAHIVTIFDSGTTDDGLPFIVMELLRGEDLGHRIRDAGRLELDAALDIVAQLLRGLCRAHDAGIVHRDLKPDNVFLTRRDDESDFVKILDFGISKVRRTGGVPEKTITRQGTVLGTPFYMSPEQAQALPDVDERTDLWSVGAILYECLTGRPPHEGHAYEQVIVNICSKDAPDARFANPAVPEPVARFLTKALQRDKLERWSDARTMLAALGAASDGLLSARATTVSSAASAEARGALGSSPGARRSSDARAALEVSPGGPSRVGWSTTGGAATGKPRARFAAAAAFALVVAAAAILVARRAPEETPKPPPPPGVSAADGPEPAPNAGGHAAEPNHTAPAPETTPVPSASATTKREIVAAPTKKATAASSAKAGETAAPLPTGKAATTKDPGIAPQLRIKTE